MSAEVTVTVSAAAGKGKSAIAELIRQALLTAGLSVTLVDENGYGFADERPGVIAGSLTERLASIAARQTPIIVMTKQLNRRGIYEQ